MRNRLTDHGYEPGIDGKILVFLGGQVNAEGLLREVHAVEEVLEARVGTEGVKPLLVHVFQHPEVAGDFHKGKDQAVIGK